jgi:hypothetical protein
MPLILGANSVSGYTVKNSLRFNSGSSDYLSRTPASSGNRQKWTYSAWIKRGKLSVNTRQCLLSAGNNDGTDSGAILIGFTDADVFAIETYQTKILTTQVFRDISAWYHIVVAVDTTQTGITNQAKLYVNGSQVTQFSSTNAFSASVNTPFNNTIAHEIGRQTNATSRFFDGYQSEVYWIDGQQLTPSSFGETDTETGIWKPKAYTGTYGTNGFFLKFLNSASLGTDSSGNGNTWTVNNLTSIDQTTDTPTNNFCTLNPLNFGAGTLSEGNLKWVGAGNVGNLAFGNIGIDMGVSTQYYWEVLLNASNPTVIGIAPTTLRWNDTTRVGSYGYYSANGNKYSGTSASAYGASFTTNDIVGVLAGNGSITFYKNGSSQGVAFSGLTGTYLPMIAEESCNVSMNFGNPPFAVGTSNTDGAGFGNFEFGTNGGYALNTKNLAQYG